MSESRAHHAPAVPSARIPMALRALRHRNFQLFFAGQLISLVGTWMQTIAQSWLVYRLTGSALLLGTVGFASQIPVFLLAPFGGTVADRRRRHRIVIATQASAMILASVLAFFTLTGRVQVWHIFVLAASLGAVNAFDIPARQAFLVEMVGKEDLMNAIALNSSMFNGARVIGPAIAGILVARIGEGWCFFGNAVSYIAVIIGLLMMKVQAPRAAQREGSALRDILEGVNFVRSTAAIRALLLMGMAPFGALLAGVAAHVFTAPITVAMGGGFCLLGGIAFRVKLPGLRPSARELLVAQGMAGGEPPEQTTAPGLTSST